MKRWLLLWLCLTGCKPQPVIHESQQIIPPEPVFASAATNGVENGIVDPATISQDNRGYVLDLDGDGNADFVQMRVDTLYWKRSCAETEAALVKIVGDILCYNIVDYRGRNSLRYCMRDLKCYIRPNLGNNNNTPFFGDAEEAR